jgi:small-conductance mechanosensitive channel
VHARVDALQRFDLEMELRRRIKTALEAVGVSIPYPQHVVHLAADGREPAVAKEHRA